VAEPPRYRDVPARQCQVTGLVGNDGANTSSCLSYYTLSGSCADVMMRLSWMTGLVAGMSQLGAGMYFGLRAAISSVHTLGSDQVVPDALRAKKDGSLNDAFKLSELFSNHSGRTSWEVQM
jgi:hypothetical protein